MNHRFATHATLAALLLLTACSPKPETLPPTPTTPYRPDPGRAYVWVTSSGSEVAAATTETAAVQRGSDNERNAAAFGEVTHESARPAVTPAARPAAASRPAPAPKPAPKKVIEEDAGPPQLDDPF